MSARPGTGPAARSAAAARRWLLGGRWGTGPVRYSGSARVSAWGIPFRLWRGFLRRRTLTLTPIAYVIVAGGGAAIGLALQLWVGAPWWMPPTVLLVAAWVLEGGSALWLRRRRGGHR